MGTLENPVMRIALLSDIHGECYPLERVLEDIQREKIERIVCLGDALQGGSQPAETLARLRKTNCPIVMGNADAWLIGEGKEEKVSEKQLEVREWSLRHFSDSDIEFIKSFHATVEIDLSEIRKLLCFHGSPRSFNDIILPKTEDKEVREFLSGAQATFFAGGHTHTQQFRRMGNSWYINPGSVSLAYNWELSNMDTGNIRLDPWADYAVISSDGNSFGVTFRHVPYDVDELERIIRASGRPYAEETIPAYLREKV